MVHDNISEWLSVNFFYFLLNIWYWFNIYDIGFYIKNTNNISKKLSLKTNCSCQKWGIYLMKVLVAFGISSYTNSKLSGLWFWGQSRHLYYL